MRFPITWAESANRRELAAFDKGNRVGYMAAKEQDNKRELAAYERGCREGYRLGYSDAQEAYLRLFASAIADRTGLIGQVEQVIGKEEFKH